MKKEKVINTKRKAVVINQKPETAAYPAVVTQQEHHMELMKIALSKDGGVGELEKVMEIQERWEKKEARKSFYASMSVLQSQIPVITKRGKASFAHKSGGGVTAYDYAKIEDITESIKPFLVQNRLSYRYEQETGDKQLITVTCIVTHADGHEERTIMSGYPDGSGSKNNIQMMASTVSYLRRYTLTGALGITVSGEDNDGGDAAQDAPNDYYDQSKFDASLPIWAESINNKKKTPMGILAYLENKDVNLSPEQTATIKRLGQ